MYFPLVYLIDVKKKYINNVCNSLIINSDYSIYINNELKIMILNCAYLRIVSIIRQKMYAILQF